MAKKLSISRSRSRFIFKHQFVLNPREVDESTLTVPDLVLSMRDVYKKYVLTGSIEGLAVRPFVQDERLMDDFPEETVDTLLMSKNLRESALEEFESRQNSGNSSLSTEPSGEGESNTRKTPPVQDGGSPGPSGAAAISEGNET